jgi:hypothetical protein
VGRLLSLLVFLVSVGLVYFDGSVGGISLFCTSSSADPEMTCLLTAGTSVSALMGSGVGAMLVAFGRPRIAVGADAPFAPVRHQVLSAFIDLVLAGVIATPVLTYLYVALINGDGWRINDGLRQLEYVRVESGGREVALALLLVGAMMITVVAYFAVHNTLLRRTVGQVVAGIDAVNTSDRPVARGSKRFLLSIVGLMVWPISVFLALRDPERQFWWNRKYGQSWRRA